MMTAEKTGDSTGGGGMDGVGYGAVLAAVPEASLVITPGGVIVEANRAYERASGHKRTELLGRTVAEVFPANPDDAAGNGYPGLAASLQRVLDTGRADLMPVQRYDIRDPATGTFVERYWNATNVPVPDEAGHTIAILHQVRDVTDLVAQRRHADLEQLLRDQGLTDPQVKAYADAQELRAVAESLENTVLRRQSAREQILLRLVTASTTALGMEAKLRALAGAAIPVLSDVCAVYLLDHPLPAGQPVVDPVRAWRLAAPTSVGVVGPVPDRSSVWTGGDPASRAIAAAATVMVSYDPSAPPEWAAAAGVDHAISEGHIHSSAVVPVVTDGVVHAFMAFGAAPGRAPYTDDERELFELVAGHTAVAMRQGERYDHVRDASLTLQRAMLTPPPRLTDVDIEVRYRPAGEGAEVGGDWHDVFHLGSRNSRRAPESVHDGIAVVVGDVAGHDLDAATVMGQLRSMLRGFTIHDGGPPDGALSALDDVIGQTGLTNLATCVVMHVHTAPDGPGAGLDITWSNAGHPSPIVLDPSGATTVLDDPLDPALGPFAAARRTSSTRRLPPGSTLLLFSDGLFERRTVPYDDAFDELCRTVAATGHPTLDALCDELLRNAPHDDDIVLVALRQR